MSPPSVGTPAFPPAASEAHDLADEVVAHTDETGESAVAGVWTAVRNPEQDVFQR